MPLIIFPWNRPWNIKLKTKHGYDQIDKLAKRSLHFFKRNKGFVPDIEQVTVELVLLKTGQHAPQNMSLESPMDDLEIFFLLWVMQN